jgi:hypothetical protein
MFGETVWAQKNMVWAKKSFDKTMSFGQNKMVWAKLYGFGKHCFGGVWLEQKQCGLGGKWFGKSVVWAKTNGFGQKRGLGKEV